jgi:transposase-like protein
MPRSGRIFSREFKLSVIGRMLAGEAVSGLAREVQIGRKELLV